MFRLPRYFRLPDVLRLAAGVYPSRLETTRLADGVRLTSALLLIVYTWAAIGIPLPRIAVTERSAERFPCESCACGCASAEQCWRSCCCHTPAQRLAWAKQHGVTPPDFVLAQAKHAAERPVCCAAKQARPTCCAEKLNGPSACCQTNSANKPARPAQAFVAWRALACQGQTLQWLIAPVTTMSIRIEMGDLLPPVGWCRPAICSLPPGHTDEPVTPPPQTV